jgi:hypothetical protein
VKVFATGHLRSPGMSLAGFAESIVVNRGLLTENCWIGQVEPGRRLLV